MDIDNFIRINACRVCLKSDTGLSMFADSELIEKFQYITQLKVKENDGLPSIICEKCVTKLKMAYDFRRQALLSESHLRAFISKINNQFKEVASTTIKDQEENEEEMVLLIEAGYKQDQDSMEEQCEDDNDCKLVKNEDQNEEDNDAEPNDSFVEEIDDQGGKHTLENDISQHIEEDYGGFIQEEDEESQNMFEDDTEEEMHLEEEEQMSSELGIENISSVDEQTTEEVSIAVIDSQYIVRSLKSSRDLEHGEHEKPLKHENRSNICIKCDKDFSTKTNLMRHMLTHDGVKPFQCTICGNGFTQNGSLKQHMLIHTGERPYKCEVCGRGFTQSKSLTFHMRRHTGEKPFACDKCGLTFRQKDGLKRHILTKHSGTTTEVHICTICNRVLQSKYSLALHMKKHLGQQEKIHKCETCERSFASKASLEIHLRQHTGEKPFRCEVCSKDFPRKSSLMTHAKIHMEEKPFKCNECDKSFVQKHQILTHMQNHKTQPAKSFQCGKCYKSFAIKRNLLQHLRNHNKESMTMFKCEECSIAFNTKRGLKLHRYNEHKEAVSDLNECDICHIPFVSVTDLNQHIMAVHDSIDEKCDVCLQHFTSKKLLEDHLLEHELMTSSA